MSKMNRNEDLHKVANCSPKPQNPVELIFNMVEKFVGSVAVKVEHVQSLYTELKMLKGSSDFGRIRELRLQIEAATEALTSQEKPLLTALRSNNLAFNIFSYFPQP